MHVISRSGSSQNSAAEEEEERVCRGRGLPSWKFNNCSTRCTKRKAHVTQSQRRSNEIEGIYIRIHNYRGPIRIRYGFHLDVKVLNTRIRVGSQFTNSTKCCCAAESEVTDLSRLSHADSQRSRATSLSRMECPSGGGQSRRPASRMRDTGMVELKCGFADHAREKLARAIQRHDVSSPRER